MKQTKLLLLIWAVFIPMVANAETVEVDGIYYNLISKAKQAEVTEHPNSYTGKVEIPSSITYNDEKYEVTKIGHQAFMNCWNLTSINIPTSVTEIGSWTFAHCTGLESINIPNSVKNIGIGAFCDCRGLTSIIIPSGISSISQQSFDGCKGLTSVNIPESVTNIGVYAFFECSALTSVTIPNKVDSIGDGAFEGCKSLTSLTIPNSVTTIDDRAFAGCSGLISLTIGSDVRIIGQFSFASCPEIKDVYCMAKTVPDTNTGVFEGSYIEYATLHVPNGSVDAYKAAEPWKNFQNIVEEGGTGINKIKEDIVSEPFDVYDVSGRRVLNCASSLNGLPQGIYIVNGKKILKK